MSNDDDTLPFQPLDARPPSLTASPVGARLASPRAVRSAAALRRHEVALVVTVGPTRPAQWRSSPVKS